MKNKKLIDQIEKIEKYIKSSNNELEALYYFKIAFAILVGAVSANLLNQVFSSGETSSIFGLLVLEILLLYLYIHLEILYRSRTMNFPDIMLEELKGQINYKTVSENLNRKNTIDNYIDRSIESLNANTCKIGYSDDPEIYKQELKYGIEKVLSDLIYRINYILNTSNSNFTIGIFLQDIIKKYDSHSNTDPCAYKTDFFILRDDLNIEKDIPTQMDSSDKLMGMEFQNYNDIKYVMNHNLSKYYIQDSNRHCQSIFMHPIPYICEADIPCGVIFIITEGGIAKENDLDTVMLIFSRILSNWLDKYNTCLYEHNLKLESEINTDPEISKEAIAMAQSETNKAKEEREEKK